MKQHLEKLRPWLVALGRAISAAALIAVTVYFVRNRVWRSVDLRNPRFCAALLGSSLAYAAGEAVMSYGWVRWLKSAGGHSVSTAAGIVLYCRSQLAKYIPGNVLHLVARQTLGSRLGAAHSALALASASESAALVMVACALGALSNALPEGFPHVPRAAAFTVAVLFLCAAVPLARFVHGGSARRSLRAQALDTLLTLACYFPFFVWSGLSLSLLLSVNHGAGSSSTAELIGVWSLCWLAGYVTPGAPGGLGVREAALLYGLSPWCSRPEAVAIAMEMRMVSTFGDVILWLAATAFRRAAEHQPDPRLEKIPLSLSLRHTIVRREGSAD